MPGAVKKTLISALIMLLIFVVAGVFYVWYNGNHGNTQPDNAPKPAETEAKAKPPKVDPNAPVGVAVQSIDSPIKAGTNASIQILTKPQSTCTIEVTDKNKVATKDSGLKAKKADDYGQATWTWTVASNTPIGTGAVKVTCVNGKKSGMVIADLEVIK